MKDKIISLGISYLVIFLCLTFLINMILLSTGMNERGSCYINRSDFVDKVEFDLYNELKEVSFMNLFTPRITHRSWHKYPEVYDCVEDRNDLKDETDEKKRLVDLDKAANNYKCK